ncbi:MAG: hypothetical protein M1826_000029 [Phylliscum demangeonii]|nr:MAG: hypothetical protein M1826_000029 [Phylliscum demangeonii]
MDRTTAPAPSDNIQDDDRPIALHREKRSHQRTRSSHADSSSPGRRAHVDGTERTENQRQFAVTITPRKKRVRFSDPGGPAASSTGLTPALQRQRLLATPRSAKTPSTRRQSLPADLAASATSASGPTTLQFAPLRQLIDCRSRRRLRRNHLSEEINAIEEEKKTEERMHRRSISDLRGEVGEKNRLLDKLRMQLDEAKALYAVWEGQSSSENVAGLESARATSAGETSFLGRTLNASVSQASVHSFAPTEMSNEEAELESVLGNEVLNTSITSARNDLSDGNEPNIAPPLEPTSRVSTGVQVSVEDPKHSLLQGEVQELKDALRNVVSELESTQSFHQRLFSKIRSHLQDMTTSFSDNPFEVDAALDTVLTSLVLAQSRAEDADIRLSKITTEVGGLGFDGANAEEMLRTIKNHFWQARLELEYLQPGENVGGFETAGLLSMLLDRVRSLLQEIKDGKEEEDNQRRIADLLRREVSNEYARAKSADAKARETAAELEERERSSRKLQDALEGYRKEVKSLEELVNRLEVEHHAALTHSHREMDEAVADLEGKLEAETKNKEASAQEAQSAMMLAERLQETIERAKTIIQSLDGEKEALLEARNSLMAQFEMEIASKDNIHQQALAGKQTEIDFLCHEKSHLLAELAEAEISIGTVTAANNALEGRIAVDVENSMRVMEAMQKEMKKCLARAGELKNGYLQSAKSGAAMPLTQLSLRLLTSAKRTKRFDSGIGVLMEEDEEMEDV